MADDTRPDAGTPPQADIEPGLALTTPAAIDAARSAGRYDGARGHAAKPGDFATEVEWTAYLVAYEAAQAVECLTCRQVVPGGAIYAHRAVEHGDGGGPL